MKIFTGGDPLGKDGAREHASAGVKNKARSKIRSAQGI
jgi:hypothetical protein